MPEQVGWLEGIAGLELIARKDFKVGGKTANFEYLFDGRLQIGHAELAIQSLDVVQSFDQDTNAAGINVS